MEEEMEEGRRGGAGRGSQMAPIPLASPLPQRDRLRATSHSLKVGCVEPRAG